jgi:hypothetical protein
MFDIDEHDPKLSIIKIEITKTEIVYLHYKQYPKPDSEKFPQDRSFLVFYFNKELINEDVLFEYFGLISKPEKIALGSFFNKKGSKRKRKIVYYAIIRFPESLEIDKIDFQLKVNEYLENKKHRKLLVDFNPLKEDTFNNIYDEDDFNQDEVDEDGFTKVQANNTKKDRFVSSKNKELSFKVCKESDDEDSFMEECKVTRKKKRKIGGRFKTTAELNESDEEDRELEETYGKKKDNGYWNINSNERQKKGNLF